MAGEHSSFKVVLEYDGTDFSGWQEQTPGVRTVQGEVQEALENLLGHPVVVQGAGRTDRGVHASGQVGSFTTSRDIPADRLRVALNGKLPPDISCRSVEPVSETFNARFSALAKHYRYSFRVSRWRSVQDHRTTAWHRGGFDLAATREAARLLEGTHDFAAFANQSKEPPSTTVRTVYRILPRAEGPRIHLEVLGRGFLYNMVRNLAGTLLEVARGKQPPAWARQVLESCDRGRGGPTAEARGLSLVEVFYESDLLENRLSSLDPLR